MASGAPQEFSNDLNGPAVIGIILESMLFGLLFALFCVFWVQRKRESAWVQASVTFVTLLATVAYCVSVYDKWEIIATSDPRLHTFAPQWENNLLPIFNTLVTVPVQAFYIHRCWNLLQRKLYVLISFSVVIAGYVTATIYLSIVSFKSNSAAVVDPKLRRDPRLSVLYYLSLALPAFVDVVTTTILIVYLMRSLRSTQVRRARRLIHRLVILVWECAIPPTLCAIASLTLFIVQNRTGRAHHWDLNMQRILTLINAMSLLIALNGRSKFPAPQENEATMEARLTTVIEVELLDTLEAPPNAYSTVDHELSFASISTTWSRDSGPNDDTREIVFTREASDLESIPECISR